MAHRFYPSGAEGGAAAGDTVIAFNIINIISCIISDREAGIRRTRHLPLPPHPPPHLIGVLSQDPAGRGSAWGPGTRGGLLHLQKPEEEEHSSLASAWLTYQGAYLRVCVCECVCESVHQMLDKERALYSAPPA